MILATIGVLALRRAYGTLRDESENASGASSAFALMIILSVLLVSTAGDAILHHPALAPWTATMAGALFGVVERSGRQSRGRFANQDFMQLRSWRRVDRRRVAVAGALMLTAISGTGVITGARRLQALWLGQNLSGIADVERVASLDPGRIDAQLGAAMYWINAGDCGRARKYLRRAQTLSPSPAVDTWSALCADGPSQGSSPK